MTETILKNITQQVQDANQVKKALRIRSGDSKAFYGPAISGEDLNVQEYEGIISYEPTELVITARCGTKLTDLQAALEEQGQYLAFEPPSFSDQATVGGMVASGLSGPGRAASGAVRDYVLGTRILNGQGQDLRFGGQVMKNVAGFDLSRLMVGALGTLGVILEVSMKVMPKPPAELTICFELSEEESIKRLNEWISSGIPISASCFFDGQLTIRLSGYKENLQKIQNDLGGEPVEDSQVFWTSLKNHKHDFFQTDQPLWRVAVPPATAPLNIEGNSLTEWAGAQRWIVSSLEADQIRAVIKQVGGHATAFKHVSDSVPVFTPLPVEMAALQKRVKQAMDPNDILNPGKIPL